MKKIWQEEAWEDYLYWQSQDKKTLKKINSLIQDIERHPFEDIGKPEPLKHDTKNNKNGKEKVKRFLFFILQYQSIS